MPVKSGATGAPPASQPNVEAVKAVQRWLDEQSGLKGRRQRSVTYVEIAQMTGVSEADVQVMLRPWGGTEITL